VTERFAAGLLGGPFGLDGLIRLQSFSGEIAHLAGLCRVSLRLQDEEHVREVEKVSGSGARAFIKFKGVDSPEAAALLRGAVLLVDRKDAAPLGKDEFYVEDLRGLRVTADSGENGEVLGTVTDVLEAGGGQLLELRLPGGELRLVPCRAEVFGEVDPAKGRAVLLNRWILE
jgi:16S rRNA processing protein RimM